MSKSKIYKLFVVFSLVIAFIPFWFIFVDNASFIADWIFLFTGLVFIFNSIASFFFPGSRMWEVRINWRKTKVYIYNWLLIILAYFPLSYLSYSNGRFFVAFYLIAFAILPISLIRIKIISISTKE